MQTLQAVVLASLAFVSASAQEKTNVTWYTEAM